MIVNGGGSSGRKSTLAFDLYLSKHNGVFATEHSSRLVYFYMIMLSVVLHLRLSQQWQLLSASCWRLVSSLRFCRWRQHDPPKSWLTTRLDGVISQKIELKTCNCSDYITWNDKAMVNNKLKKIWNEVKVAKFKEWTWRDWGKQQEFSLCVRFSRTWFRSTMYVCKKVYFVPVLN
jgi:hypothetical protein